MLFNTRTYNSSRVNGPDSQTYAGPAHTLTVSDTVTMARVYPKPNGDFLGVARPSLKRVKTLVVNSTTNEMRDAIVNVGGSIPVGAAAADIDALLADLAAFFASNEAKNLFKSLTISA